MPRRRHAFSFIELSVGVVLLGLLAYLLYLVVGPESQEALVVTARGQLAAMRRQVLARAMGAPGYHFTSLEEALELREAPVDPWGTPYVLMHTRDPVSRKRGEVYWSDGESDELYHHEPGPEQGLVRHWLVSAGPNITFQTLRGLTDAEVRSDDLAVPLPLGRTKPCVVDPYGSSAARLHPTSHVPSAGPTLPTSAVAPPADGTPPPLEASSRVRVKIFDYSAEDADYVELRLNGAVVESGLLLTHAGVVFELDLRTGPNLLTLVSLDDGSKPPCSPALEVDGSLRFIGHLPKPRQTTVELYGP